MNFSNIKPAKDYEVENWLRESLNLTEYQKSKLLQDEIVRWAPFEFYKERSNEKATPLWRLTLFLFPIFWIILFIGLPIVFIIKGKWGYNDSFALIRFYHFWCRKLNL